MTNHITQHLPVSSFDKKEEADFNTTEELLALPWVQEWATQPDFICFVKHNNYLLALFDVTPGKLRLITTFRHVGFMTNPDSVDLPNYIN